MKGIGHFGNKSFRIAKQPNGKYRYHVRVGAEDRERTVDVDYCSVDEALSDCLYAMTKADFVVEKEEERP